MKARGGRQTEKMYLHTNSLSKSNGNNSYAATPFLVKCNELPQLHEMCLYHDTKYEKPHPLEKCLTSLTLFTFLERIVLSLGHFLV